MTTPENASTSQNSRIGWPEYIGLGCLIYLEQIEAEGRSQLDRSLPKVHATEDEVIAAEMHLGFQLPASYRTFLLAANGWPNFHHDVAIFSTSELTDGPLYQRTQSILGLPETTDALAADNIPIVDYFPIAASATDIDIFLMGKPETPGAGAVVWFADKLIDQYTDFHDFYMAMLEYNRRALHRLRERNGLPPKPLPGEKGYQTRRIIIEEAEG
ncbi:SMI1/KNR4 family protein [Actinobaculum sp. 352]|uniref:SMI1/KNR4 family protein n=1 Tax=Actinobaculum sp. 352 TaxID=2490946 RepID=UPI000F7FA344|nr:SMI1/KNR4 family protein [Actinobaculum sp. 352]RTE48036.1 SMI1/KNR4 family protein [Actinobaculum sp. 352]